MVPQRHIGVLWPLLFLACNANLVRAHVRGVRRRRTRCGHRDIVAFGDFLNRMQHILRASPLNTLVAIEINV